MKLCDNIKLKQKRFYTLLRSISHFNRDLMNKNTKLNSLHRCENKTSCDGIFQYLKGIH